MWTLSVRSLSMTAPGILERVEATDGGSGGHWIVTVFNNDHNTWDEVIDVLMRATGCPLEEAEMETWEIDNLGKSVVHHGAQEECEEVASVIRQIGIEVKVSSE